MKEQERTRYVDRLNLGRDLYKTLIRSRTNWEVAHEETHPEIAVRGWRKETSVKLTALTGTLGEVGSSKLLHAQNLGVVLDATGSRQCIIVTFIQYILLYRNNLYSIHASVSKYRGPPHRGDSSAGTHRRTDDVAENTRP